jgi:FkbM family methyltransferase
MRTVTNPYGIFTGWDLDIVTQKLETGIFWEEHLRPAMDGAPTDGMAIDLGANIGFFTIYFASRFSRVLAVEAHPGTCAFLRRNVEQNGVADRVRVVQGAAYDRHTTLQPACDALHGWSLTSVIDMNDTPCAACVAFVEAPEHQRPGSELLIPTVVVDELLDPADPVRLIKVDCQGADLRALYGCQQTIARWRPRVIYEYEGAVSACRGDDLVDYERFFDALGYTTTRVREDLWDFVADPAEDK